MSISDQVDYSNFYVNSRCGESNLDLLSTITLPGWEKLSSRFADLCLTLDASDLGYLYVCTERSIAFIEIEM
jgi:hypothetical protein